jgi:hypothetical protein
MRVNYPASIARCIADACKETTKMASEVAVIAAKSQGGRDEADLFE